MFYVYKFIWYEIFISSCDVCKILSMQDVLFFSVDNFRGQKFLKLGRMWDSGKIKIKGRHMEKLMACLRLWIYLN